MRLDANSKMVPIYRVPIPRRDHVFIGNQREQLQKEPAHANLPLPSPLMFWGRCLSVDFEGIWGRC
jgi:hypothetical protein